MRVALHDSDSTGFPNLALMKLSAHHKARGDEVCWYSSLDHCIAGPFGRYYGKIYSSKVFDFTPPDPYLAAGAIKGGTGYSGDHVVVLTDEIEHVMPDYTLYPTHNYSMGFLTRGCPRSCDWCVVPTKEGQIQAHADIEEFLAFPDVVLLDNNVLASEHGIKQIEKIIELGLRVDFNQGLDARLIDNEIAKLLGKVKWLKPVRLACDFKGQIPALQKAIELLRWHNVTPRRYFVYVLVKEIEDAVDRVRFLKGMDVDPFAQPYIPPGGGKVTLPQAALARWVNHKAEFKSRTWEEYARAHGVFQEVE